MLSKFATGTSGPRLASDLEALLYDEFKELGFDETGNVSSYGEELEKLMWLVVLQKER